MLNFWIPAVKGNNIQNMHKSATNSLAFLNYLSCTFRNSPRATLKPLENGNREQYICICIPVLPVPCLHFSGDARWLLMETSQAERKFDGLCCPPSPAPATPHYKTLCSTNAWAGFWPELSVPRRFYHHKCSSLAGSRFLPSLHPRAALCDGRKVAESFTLLSLCLQIPHGLKALISSPLPSLWRRDAKLTSWLSFAQWSSFSCLFSSLPHYMIFVFGKQLQISLVAFLNITVIIAYTTNYTKSNLMEVIY